MCHRQSKVDHLLLILKQCLRHPHNVNNVDLTHWLNRPSEHLHQYTTMFEALRTETAEESPDIDLLKEAVYAMKNLQSIAQLRTLQTGMGKGPTGMFEWHNLVTKDVRNRIGKQEAKRQA